MADAFPERFVFMLKMEGCHYCDVTIENIQAVLRKKKSEPPRFFASTRKQYQDIERFVNSDADHDAIKSVGSFPTLFVIANRKIIKTVRGQQSVQELASLFL